MSGELYSHHWEYECLNIMECSHVTVCNFVPLSKYENLSNTRFFHCSPFSDQTNGEISDFFMKHSVFNRCFVRSMLKMNETRVVSMSYLYLSKQCGHQKCYFKPSFKRILCVALMNFVHAYLDGLRINYK